MSGRSTLAVLACLSGPLFASAEVILDTFDITTYETRTDCNPEDDSSYRIYTGINNKVCQPIGPGATSGDVTNLTNQCQEYIHGGTSNQECSYTVWVAHGVLYQYTEGIEYCNVYVADDCTGDPLGLNLEEIPDAGLCEPFAGGFSSFLCAFSNEKTSNELTELGDPMNPASTSGAILPVTKGPSRTTTILLKINGTMQSCSEAWNDFVNQWQNHESVEDQDDFDQPNDGDQSLTDFMANYFHVAPAPSCGHIDDNCDATITCGQDGTAPAGYIIMNSVFNLHRQYDNFWNGLEAAQGDITNEYKAFSDAFNPILSTVKEQKQALDAILLVLPFFGDNSNTLGVVKDTTNALITFGIAYSRDGISSDAQTVIQNDVENYMVGIIKSMQTAIETTVENMFTPPSDWTPLYDAISNGKLFSGESAVDGVSDYAGDTKKLIYASTLSYMWRPGGEAGMAWIATADGMPTNDSLAGCDKFLPSEGYGENADWFVSPDTNAVARFCDGDQAYWILYNTMDASICLNKRIDGSGTPTPAESCEDEDNVVVGQPFGIENLDGEAFSGLSVDIMGLNAVNAWKANGNANGWAVPDLTNVNDIDAISDATIETVRGLVNIPVCSFEDMRAATEGDVWNTLGNANWPCPA
ncbi:hypothetical protein LTR37_006573 [Vermiconidia calcicola]|uniref:Uncharacterized protein n=1 Tax=Vermiconidia calcicola TaxID=1690605 RepID=A0ACC3NFJ1_9PEZI|nr:hypothetical protein LTR37_006573 [Vermiconidia calcicola]